jgi:hypothetical protein
MKPVNDVKQDMLDAERSEQMVWSELYRNADSGTKKQLGISIEKYLDADCLVMRAMPAWFLNRVIGLGLEQIVTEQDIDNLIDQYHSNEVPIGISLCPSMEAEKIERWLIERGFSIANYWVKMVRDNSPPKPSNSTLRVDLASPDQAGIVAKIVKSGFELDEKLSSIFGTAVNSKSNRVYIAWDKDIPASVGMLTVVGDVGHLNTAATLPEFRGRGGQGAIMAKRIQDGIDLGCRRFVTETWDPGNEINHSYNNMLRHGFKLAYKRPNWTYDIPLK